MTASPGGSALALLIDDLVRAERDLEKAERVSKAKAEKVAQARNEYNGAAHEVGRLADRISGTAAAVEAVRRRDQIAPETIQRLKREAVERLG